MDKKLLINMGIGVIIGVFLGAVGYWGISSLLGDGSDDGKGNKDKKLTDAQKKEQELKAKLGKDKDAASKVANPDAAASDAAAAETDVAPK